MKSPKYHPRLPTSEQRRGQGLGNLDQLANLHSDTLRDLAPLSLYGEV